MREYNLPHLFSLKDGEMMTKKAPLARARPGRTLRKLLSPEEFAALDKEWLDERDAAVSEVEASRPYLEIPPTQEEREELSKLHKPCPWDGPHVNVCNMTELIFAL